MKRTVLSMVIVGMSFSSFAQEQMSENEYLSKNMSFGVEFFNSSNEFTVELDGFGLSEDIEDDSNGFALQLGRRTGSSNTLTTTFEYRNENFDLPIYDDENDTLHYFSVGLLKEFPLENKLSPYIRGSAGFGFMSIEGYSEDTANALGLKLGAGLAYYPTSSVKIHGGLDWQYRTWTPVETTVGDIEIDETSVILGAGISYLF